MPRVSFVVAARNTERYVGDAIDSILSQTYDDLELIFVDDASTDATRRIVEARKDPRIRIISGPGTGISSASNVGICAARGEFVARLDADDVAEPDRVRQQVEYFDSHPEVVLLGSWARLIADDSTLVGELRVPTDQRAVGAEVAAGRNPFLHPTVMFRRLEARTSGPFDARMDGVGGEDAVFLHNLCRLGQAANLPLPLVRYRLARGAISNGFSLLPTGLQRGRQRALQRVCLGAESVSDFETMRSVAAAARAIDPELAYNYRVGKVLLETHGDPCLALRFLLKAWCLRPTSLRAQKNLLVAAARMFAKGHGRGTRTGKDPQ